MLSDFKNFVLRTGYFLRTSIKWDIREALFEPMTDCSAYEVLSVILPSVLLVFICTTFTTIFHSKLENTRWRYVCDFCFVGAPQIFIITVLVPYIGIVTHLFALLCLATVLLAYFKRKGSKHKNFHYEEKKHFITNVRSMINLITVIAILAVDFKIFPKQFKKKLKYGYSLMDVGVGLFVYANAIVAPEIKTRDSTLKKSIIDTVPLIVLGIGRYIATTATNYNVSITEYGKHWNFFITLALTRIISSIILVFLPIKWSFIYGILILIFHEALLQNGLADYVLGSANRSNLFSANREGITSTLGFVALYFLSTSLGIWMNLKEKGVNSKLSSAAKFIAVSIILLPLTFTLEDHFGLSRRLANSAYCIWILFIGVFMTTSFYLVELLQRFIYERFGFANHIHTPFLLDAINFNGLIYFLLANILTGFVNMACNTLLMGPWDSLLILIVYVNVTSIVISILYVQKINLKLIIACLLKPKRSSMI